MQSQEPKILNSEDLFWKMQKKISLKMAAIKKNFIKIFVSILRSHTTTPVFPSVILTHGNFKGK